MCISVRGLQFVVLILSPDVANQLESVYCYRRLLSSCVQLFPKCKLINNLYPCLRVIVFNTAEDLCAIAYLSFIFAAIERVFFRGTKCPMLTN